MTIAVTDPAGGETINAGPLTIRILEDGTNTAGRLGLVELTIPPHTDGPPQHIHREHDETFYTIAGVTSFTTGTDTVLALPGTLVTAPPGTPHTFGNPTDEPAILLCTVTPRHYIDYFRALATLRRGPDGLDPRDVAELMSHYATDVVHQDRPQ